MKYFFVLLLCICCAFKGIAQPYIIRGSITDTLNEAPLPMASVVLIRTADSVIEARARTLPDGNFQTTVRTKGKYFLRVTFPGFADYIDAVTVSKPTTDLGNLPMISRSHLLKEFVLTQQISAIKIKGDTTEYMADSFKVKEGATVEDLLKKLPGIQVDKNGQIIAQGEAVQKVLVDGEEFFSDDPKVVTRGLQADAVKKVQVYDKKSDQADFTGIDDGQKTKTINLELKDEKKKGYFGKADAGGGSDGYFQNQGMINAFRAKRQLSAFGIASNTDKAGLGWQDNDKFGAGNGTTEITDDGSFITASRSDEDFNGWDGRYNGEGLPSTWTGGAHYADKWNETKQHVSANYRFARQNVELDGNTATQYSLPGDEIRVMDVEKDQFSTGDRHGLDIMYDWKIDSNTSVKITANAGVKKSYTSSEYDTKTYIRSGDVLGDTSLNTREITSDANAQFINADFLFRKKLKKKGRTISLDGKENFRESTSTGYFNSAIYNASGTGPVASTNQQKINNAGTLAFSGKLTYTEPLSKVAYTEISYGLTVNNSTAENKSFDALTSGDYNSDPNDTFSSDYRFNILSNTGGLNFKFVFKKVNFNFGGDVSKTDYAQTDLMNGGAVSTNEFINIFPKAAFTYRIGKQTSLNLNYLGNTRQPSINQVQPLTQNIDPLNITLGNPGLRQEFTNRISLRFNDYKIMQSRFLWANASFSHTTDAISTEQTTIGPVNTTRYINVDGNYNGFGFLGYGFKLGKTDFTVGAQTSGSVYHVNSIINSQKNSSDNTSVSFGPYVQYDKENKFEMRWNPQLTYNNNVSTNNPATISYYILNNDLSGSVQLPEKFEIGSSVDMMFRQKTEIFTANNNVIKWNAYVEKKFLKKGQLALRASVFDILNQNLGFSRTANGSIVTQNSFNTIRRYAMLNLIWNFTHTPAGAPPPSGGGMMFRK